jgi:hypothetical protein
MAVKLAKLNTAKTVAVVIVAVIKAERVIAVVAAAVVIYKLVYFCSSFYSINAY